MTMERAGAIVDSTIASRTRRSMIVSVIVHIVGVALWIVIARPTIPEPQSTQVVRSVKLNRSNTPEPSTPEPEPPPEPEPEPEPEPPEPEPEPLKKRDKKNSPPPPPPPECKNCAMTSDLTPDDVNPANTKNAIPMGVPGGVPGGVLGGVPGGVVGGVIGGTGTELPAVAPRNPTPPPQKKKRRNNVRPIGSIMAHAMFTPDPDPRQLAATKAGRGDRETGVSKVAFCVDEKGRTKDIRVVRKYPGDAGVDRICRQAVTKWRFKPFFSNGKKVVVCTTMKFEIVFE